MMCHVMTYFYITHHVQLLKLHIAEVRLERERNRSMSRHEPRTIRNVCGCFRVHLIIAPVYIDAHNYLTQLTLIHK